MLKKYFYYTLPILFILGGVGHFLYDITGNNFIIGLFFPVNESIYEHTKLCFIPLLLFYLFGYFKFKPNKKKWMISFTISLFISIFLIPLLYYFYTNAFGIENMIVDIFIFFISITIGQLVSLHYFNYGKNNLYKISIFLFIMYVIFNEIVTISPPNIPLFKDPIDNTYGIQKKNY